MSLKLRDERPIATKAADFRILARVILKQGEGRGLLAFGATDNHIHAELAVDRRTAGMFARYVECALGWQLGLGSRFESARIRPLVDQRHAERTFWYAQRQVARHGLAVDSMRDGTSLQDHLRIRLVAPSIADLALVHLPRLKREELLLEFPVGTFDERPIDLEVLGEGAAAVYALADLRGGSVESARARRAAVHAAGLDVSASKLSEALGIGVRAVHALRKTEREPLVIRAVKGQCLLRSPPKNAR